MNTIALIIIGITTLFIIFGFLKAITGWRLCTLCASIFTAWAVLTVLYWMGLFGGILIIAVLIGSSVTGIYYSIMNRIHGAGEIFRLPLFLTLFLLALLLLGMFVHLLLPVLAVVLLWLLIYGVYAYRSRPAVKKVVDQLVACCKGW